MVANACARARSCRQARLVTDLLLHIIAEWRDCDVLAKYHELADNYRSSDDEPLVHSKVTPNTVPHYRQTNV